MSETPLETIFFAALERDPAQRSAFLAEACAGDANLRERVERMLAAQQAAGNFLESPPSAVAKATDPTNAQPTEGPGTQIGPYKLLQKIGEGGMGTVFMAEQTHPVQRSVAIKVIKPGMDSRQVIARFEVERQALALMDHVNIARVLDAGNTDTGRPYFVMELVHGVAITKYCDDNRLTLAQRLELFVPVCQAIQHAHQKGIIHRDIKPSNVMITLYDGRPVPKVIDFGVSKAIEQRLTERTLFTQYGTMVGTLEYMSPEQAEMSGLGVDTRSDIYSLGVLLYELLAGSTPLGSERMRSAGFAEILRLIREEEPPKPSTRLSDSAAALATISAQRHTEPAKLPQLLRGELDWIVMKTLEKDRNRRYESASGLGLDIQRYLADEPVQACPPTILYRFGKFARRNKAGLAIVAVICLAAVTLIAGTLWHNRQLAAKVREVEAERTTARRETTRADANFAKTLEAVDRFLSQIGHRRLAQIPGMEKVRREVLEDALAFFEGFLQQNGDSPGLRSEAGWANFRAGQIQNLLGRHAAAEKSYRRASELLGQLATEFPDRADYRKGLASCETNLAMIQQATGQSVEAERTYLRALELNEKLATQFPKVVEYRRNLARSLADLGPLLKNTGRLAEAEVNLRRAITMQEKLVKDHPADLDCLEELAMSQENFGVLLKATGRPKEAEEAYRRAVNIYEKLTTETPAGGGYRQELASSYFNLGLLLEDTSRPEEAADSFRRALELSKTLVADFPAVPEHRSFLATCYLSMARVYEETDQAREFEPTNQQALDLLRELARDFPQVPQYRRDLAGCLNNMGAMLYALRRFTESEACFRDVLTLRRELADSPSASVSDVSELATTRYNFGNLLNSLNRDEEAAAEYRAAQKLFEQLTVATPQVMQNWHLLGAVLNNLSSIVAESEGEPAARKMLERAIEVQTKALNSNPRHPGYRAFLANHHRSLGELMLREGEHAQAALQAAEAPKLFPQRWQESLRAGQFLSRCASLAEKDLQLTEDQRRMLVKKYGDQAMNWLNAAFDQECPNLGEQMKSSSYDALTSREDFQALLKKAR